MSRTSNDWYLEDMNEALDFQFEKRLWSQGLDRVAGVDEVGRGCLAGPVVAAACILPAWCDPLDGVRDSKLTRREEREELARYIVSQAKSVALGAASCREIDRVNIRAASVLAMRRALARLGPWQYALVDGPLPPELAGEPAEGIVGGDAICPSIACASILAKTARDNLMAKLARRHPEYGWESNVGYGTTAHQEALAKLGPTPHHRFSFQPISQLAMSFTTSEDREE